MELTNIPFHVTDWASLPAEAHQGEVGVAYWKTLNLGCVRVRMVEYTPGYKADHWCSRGHVLLVLKGVLITELDDGRIFTLSEGMSYQVQHEGEAHRSSTIEGATLFIVD